MGVSPPARTPGAWTVHASTRPNNAAENAGDFMAMQRVDTRWIVVRATSMARGESPLQAEPSLCRRVAFSSVQRA
jgi:hypothetical protein